MFDFIDPTYRTLVAIAAALGVGALTGFIVTKVLLAILRAAGQRTKRVFLTSVHRNLARPATWFGTLLGMFIAVYGVAETDVNAYYYTERIVQTLLYGVGAWLIVQAVEVLGDLLLERYQFGGNADNFQQRKIYTQLQYIKQVITVVAAIIALAFVLLQFDNIRQFGAGLLASAGIAGIAIGLAAQKSLANLLAGFQIAFTQPIRIDDQIAIAGEVGRVEEITLTYVVVKIWDERRLVVPLNKFIDETFQNWTRSTTELIGVVLLYLDYGADLEGLRKEVDRIVMNNPLWDERVKSVQVTDTSEYTMTVRVLVSAKTSGDTFGLRCVVREGALEYLRKNQPQALPKRRLDVPTSQLASLRNVATTHAQHGGEVAEGIGKGA